LNEGAAWRRGKMEEGLGLDEVDHDLDAELV
jgi:hypothetical protein